MATSFKSYVEEYIDFLRKHRETHCCRKLGQLYFDDIEPIIKGENEKYYFDPQPGNLLVQFIQGEVPDMQTFKEWISSIPPEFSISNESRVRYLERKRGINLGFVRQFEGKNSGYPLILMLWQKSYLQILYGIKDRKTKKRRYTDSWLEVARKNGKTTLQGALALWGLIEEAGAKVYIASAGYRQSRDLWGNIDTIRLAHPALTKRIGRRLNPTAELYLKKGTGSIYCLANNPTKQDGFKPSLNIIDEAHALKVDVYNILKEGTATREQPLTNIITTAGYVRGQLFDSKYELYSKVLAKTVSLDNVLVVIYELDDPKTEMWDEKYWYKANPGLGEIKKIDYLRGQVETSKSDITVLHSTQVKDFNIVGVRAESWLSAEVINQSKYGPYDPLTIDNPIKQAEFLKQFDSSVTIAGYDLSRTGDLTSACIMLIDSEKKAIIFKNMYWITKSFLTSAEAKMAGVPWEAWVNAGYIKISTNDNAINYHDVASWFLKEFEEHGYIMDSIRYDSWSAVYLVEELHEMGWQKDYCQKPVRQGFKTLSIPSQTLATLMKNGQVCTLNNPVTTWMYTNVEMIYDTNGNQMPRKMGDQRACKIDGPATNLNCVVGLCENIDSYLGGSE